MGANDILVRLIMDANGYNRDISRSERKTKEFEKNLRSGIGNAMSVFTKFTGAVGAGVTIFEAFDKTVKSSEQTQAAWSKMVGQAKSSVDSFFMTLSTGGSINAFIQNLENVIRKAGDLANILNGLQNTSLFGGHQANIINSQIEELLSKAKDSRYTEEERKAFLAQAEELRQRLPGVYGSLAEANAQAYHAALRTELSKMGMKGDISDSMLDSLIDMGGGKRLSMGNEYGSLLKATSTPYTTMVAGVPAARKMAEYMSTEAGQLAEAAYYMNMLDKSEGSALDKALKMREASAQFNAQLAAIGEKISSTGNSVPTGGGTTSVTPATVYGAGSLGLINQQLSALQQQFTEATDEGTRIGIQKAINELEAKKQEITFYANIKAVGSAAPGAISASDFSIAGTEYSPVKLENMKPVKALDIQLNNEYADSLNAIGSAMGAISTMTGEGAAAWLQWGANVASAIAQVLPQIETLIAAKTAEGAVAAGASAAETPLVGWLLAGGAIASFLAAVASVPKFADGGIVGGSSFIGDRNIARVNSGEMILSGSQQARLFDMINGGGIGSGGQVEFKIRGQELYGVLNNYNNKRSKVR